MDLYLDVMITAVGRVNDLLDSTEDTSAIYPASFETDTDGFVIYYLGLPVFDSEAWPTAEAEAVEDLKDLDPIKLKEQLVSIAVDEIMYEIRNILHNLWLVAEVVGAQHQD